MAQNASLFYCIFDFFFFLFMELFACADVCVREGVRRGHVEGGGMGEIAC